MEIVQHAAQLPEPLETLLLIYPPLTGEEIVQGNSFHEVLHDVDILRRFKDIHDPGQHRMLEPFEDIGLRQKIKPGGLIFADLLYRPAGVEADVLRQVDGGHAAFADKGFEFVGVVEDCSHVVSPLVLSLQVC